ncbi:MAG: GNAT family N-acetyltransferase [Bacteroidota bacterium]
MLSDYTLIPMIDYRIDKKITTDQFIDVLNRSTLGERRPVNDRARMEQMVANCDLLITAWDGDKLVGVSRALTDFTYCCYLSDLAVDVGYQKQGIGKELIRITNEQSGEKATLILLSAPAAVNYYPKIGMERFTDCFLIRRK